MATGDSRLSNTARLLAAQEINRRALQKKANEKLAKIEAERQKDAEKRFNRQRELLAKRTADNKFSANIAKFQRDRLEADITKQKATDKEKGRVAEINRKAIEDKKRALVKVISGTGTDIGLLSGRVTVKDDSGRIVGLSNVEHKSAVRAKTLIVKEIERREVERTKVSDLERFLSNEKRLAEGKISTKELRQQIAARKARGLSKTPQQKRLLQMRSDDELDRALKKRGGTVSSFAQLNKEGERSRAKSQKNFGNTQNRKFISVRGAGASFQARAKDSSIGQINSQLAFLQKRRTTKSAGSKHNEQVALQIASGNFFTNLSDFDLGNIISGGQGKNVKKARSAKESVGAQARSKSKLNTGGSAGAEVGGFQKFSPFAIIAQQDIPDPVTGVTDREVQLFREKIISENRGKPLDEQERVPDTSEFFPTGRAPRADDPFNSFTFGNFGGTDTTKLDSEGGNIANPFAVDKSLLTGGGKDARGGFESSIFSDTQTEADKAGARKFANRNKLVQRQTDLGALSKSLLRKNTARGQEIEAQNALAPPRFSSRSTFSVQAQQAQAPTQLSLREQRIPIGTSGVTKQDGKFFSASGKQLKGRALVIAKQQDTSQSFGQSSTQTGQPAFAFGQQQSKADKKLAEARFNTAQNKKAREQGGIVSPSGDFSIFSLGGQDQFQQGRSTKGLVKAGGSFNRTQTFGGQGVDRFQQPRNLSVNLFESIQVSDSAKPKTVQPVRQAPPSVFQPIQQTQKLPTPTPPRQSTPSTPSQQNFGNIFDVTGISQGIRSGVQGVGKAVSGVASGIQGIIDSPFGDFASSEIKGALADPKGVVEKGVSAGQFFFGIASGNDPFKVSGKTQPLLNFKDSLAFSGLQR